MVWFHQCLFKMFKVTVYFPVGKDTAIITFGESIRIYHIIYIIYIHMCVSVCIYIYICIHICRETLSKSKRFNQQSWTFFLWSTKKNIPRFEVKWNWICRICPIAMGRCSYMFLMTSLYNWIFKATGLIWAYFQSVLRVMGISPTTMVIFHWISGGGDPPSEI